MRKTAESCAVILFEAALVLSIVSNVPAIRYFAMIILFPAVLFISLRASSSNAENTSDIRLSAGAIAVSAQGIIWDTAIQCRGSWITAFFISVILVFPWLLFKVRNSD